MANLINLIRFVVRFFIMDDVVGEDIGSQICKQ